MAHVLAVATETKASLEKFRNAWSHHLQVLCTN